MKKHQLYSYASIVLFICAVFLSFNNLTMRKKVRAAQEQLQQMEVECYIQSLPELESLNMEKTPSGLFIKDGQYLIRTPDDMILLAGMVNSGQKIDDNTLAANASYRLLEDLDFGEGEAVSKIGTDEIPFNGTLDGDGHTISGYFLEHYEDPLHYLFGNRSGTVVNLEVDNTMETVFSAAGKENLFSALQNVPFIVDTGSSPYELCITVKNQEQCDSLLNFLDTQYPKGSLHLTLDSSELYTVDLARYIYQRKIGRFEYINVNKAQADSDALDGFLSIPSSVDISGVCNGEGESLYFFRKEMVSGISCCSFIFGKGGTWDETAADTPPIYILADGVWGDQKDFHQLFTVDFPTVSLEEITRRGSYRITMNDINYDGHNDLVIRSLKKGDPFYRSAVWNPEEKEFRYFKSMPEQIFAFDRGNKRIILRQHIGEAEETIMAYEIVNGEYKETKRLVLIRGTAGQYLYYYEEGKLKDEREIESEYEAADLYPDFDYWRKG